MSINVDYQSGLNPAQLEAASTLDGPVLVIAGAGSGKTRTVVYRLAKLVSSGIPPWSILLLTFTRKASQEMLDRAAKLLGQRGMSPLYSGGEPSGEVGKTDTSAHSLQEINLGAVQGGTFHAFAYSILRQNRPSGYISDPSIMDSSDSIAAIQHCREDLSIAKGERSFPKNQTVLGLFSKSRNKELALEEVIRRDAYHLLQFADDLERIYEAYTKFKRSHGLMDYDDLLFELERLFMECPDVLERYHSRFRYIMVDEYQDTNLVQCRLVRLLAGMNGNIMAVGDDAQSIYAFRGANVRNILGFTDHFPEAKIIKLEENYRSTQPILNLCNSLLDYATENFKKHLFTQREDDKLPQVIRPLSDLSQARMAAARIIELLGRYDPHEIAVLFRSGYHSYHLEVELNKMGIRFRKYGGIRYAEAQHIKDVMSYARLLLNPLDFTAFQRMAGLAKGVGAKTCLKIYQALQTGNQADLKKACARFETLGKDLAMLEKLRSPMKSGQYEQSLDAGEAGNSGGVGQKGNTPASIMDELVENYRPYLEAHFPDDHPKRLQGLEELVQIAATYSDLDLFVADLCLEDPLNKAEEGEDRIVLSTIHSSKGLEWSAVIIIDLVEERFPSRMSMMKAEDFEEERRLMYVACTRAKDELYLFAPATLYDRGSGGANPAQPSPFIRELKPELYEEWQESYMGNLNKKEAYQAPKMRLPSNLGSATLLQNPATPRTNAGAAGGFSSPASKDQDSSGFGASRPEAGSAQQPRFGFCSHRIFGRGKIIEELPPDKYRVNFAGFGLKVILAEYLKMDD